MIAEVNDRKEIYLVKVLMLALHKFFNIALFHRFVKFLILIGTD